MMGAPKPWPTRWPEPETIPSPLDPDTGVDNPMGDPDYDVEVDPAEIPVRLPEEKRAAYAVTWGVTHPCNLRCDHCYDVTGQRRTDLTTSQALSVIDRLAQAGITFIVFSGGEPLLRKDLLQLMAYSYERRIQIGMRCNGTLVTHDIARQLAEVDLQVAGVSLDGADSATHDLVRGAGTFARTKRGVEALLSAGLRVNLEVVLSRRNAHERLDFVRLAESWGVQEINFSAIAPQGRAQQLADVMLDHTLWRKITSELYVVSKTATVSVSPSCALTGTCWACVEPNITCDGWVTPCYLSKKKLFPILEVAPEEFQARLRRNRPGSINICGRNHWLNSPTALLSPGQNEVDGGDHILM